MNITRDKFLTEAMGECWHEPNNWPHSHSIIITACRKCGARYPAQFLDFSSWQGFGKLYEWSIKQEWWPYIWCQTDQQCFDGEGMGYYVDPDRFADFVYEFLERIEQDKLCK